MISKKDTIAFIGMGKFGTAVAYALDKTNRYKIKFYTRDRQTAEVFNTTKSNPRCLSEYFFSNASASDDIISTVQNVSIVFITVASRDIENVARQLCGILPKKAKIILCSKGVSENSPYFYSEIFQNIIGRRYQIYVFSGPNFADEIIAGDLSITTLAGKSLLKTKLLSLLFRGTNIKMESTNDIRGVQIFGAMKNIMAISVGILEGMGFGKNRTIRAIMHFVKEIQKLNKAYKAKRNTAYLSAGIGDIMLTCFDNKSRNKKFGLAIGMGESVEKLVAEDLIEGYYAIKAIRNMSHSLSRFDKKSLAYINALYDILYNNKDPRQTLTKVEDYHGKRVD